MKIVDKIICFVRGHNWFRYVSSTTAPEGEQAIWCGRCSAETTEEALERERIALADAIFEYAQRRSQYY